jgi:hypothetical protein
VAVGPLLDLVTNGDGDILAPHVLDELAVSLVGGVELDELVSLPVGADLEGGLPVLATDHEGTVDDTVVVGTVHGLGTEEVLAGSLKAGLEATDEVVGHEGELELVVVLVVDLPERVLIGLELLPEPGHGDGAGILVGELALPVIEDESGLAKSLKRVLGLGGLGGGSSGSGSGSGSGLGLLLLLGGDILDHLLSELRAGEDRLEVVLVDNGGVPTGGSGVLRAPLLVKDSSEGAGEEGGSEDISQSDALTNKEGVGGEVSLKRSDGLQGSLGSLVDGLLVVAIESEEGTVPGTELGEDLSVGEGQPAEDGSVVLLGLAEESGLLVLGGDYEQDMLVSRCFETRWIQWNITDANGTMCPNEKKGGPNFPPSGVARIFSEL